MLCAHHTFFKTCLIFCSLGIRTAFGYQWPSPQFDTLEDFLYEGARPDGSSMLNIVDPCKKRTGTEASIAAEWLRLAYHDAATYNKSDGTGGLDGSIAFELNRTDNSNVGSGMTNSIADFHTFPNLYISRSDIIAIATVWSVATCGGPVIPFRGGRIDASAAGPFGVPDPSQDIQTHIEIFDRQGFSPSDMIALVACGHTLGGVRYPDFPTVVGPNTANPSLPNVVLFDGTQTFDNAVVTKYLNGSTEDPLVVLNQTMASDLRVFSYDGNVTMQGLADPDNFTNTCTDVLERMINLVPSTVNLTDVISLVPAKVSGVQLSIGTDNLVLKASLRLQDSPSNPSRTVNIYWCDRYGDAASCTSTVLYSSSARTRQITSPLLTAPLVKYDFVVPVDSGKSVTKFWFQIDEHNGTAPWVENNGGSGYEIDQDKVLFVPSLSTVNVLTQTYTIVAAVRNDTTPSRVYMDAFDRSTTGYIPFNSTIEFTPDSSQSPVAGYSFYTATVKNNTGTQLTFDLHGAIENGTVYSELYQQALFIGEGSPSATTVNTTTASGSGAKPESTSGSNSAARLAKLQGAGWIWMVLAVIGLGFVHGL